MNDIQEDITFVLSAAVWTAENYSCTEDADKACVERVRVYIADMELRLREHALLRVRPVKRAYVACWSASG